jgi:transposase
MSTTIAIDVAKSVFEVALADRPGRVGQRYRLSRGQFVRFLTSQRPATVLMEACGMAHYWGRRAVACGHRVVLLPPHAVRPYVPRNKTDRADATAMLEAQRRHPPRPGQVGHPADAHRTASLALAQQGRCRPRQQARAHRLGRLDDRHRVPRRPCPSQRPGSVIDAPPIPRLL